MRETRHMARMFGLAAGGLLLLIGSGCAPLDVEDLGEAAPTETAPAQETPTPDTSASTRSVDPPEGVSTAELVQIVQESVVRVAISSGVGSGFVADEDGYIVTNHHVIANGMNAVEVTLQDGSVHEAEVVGSDEASDMAVLRIDAGRLLQSLDIADLHDVQVGEDVVAIGFALDLTEGTGPPSVTRGIVSAKNRVIQTRNILGAVQTDAAINHGNSGGPLLNYAGEVVGVNTALAPTQEGGIAQNIGFAVGSDTVRAVYEEIRAKGTVERAFLGIAGFSSIRSAEARALGIPGDTQGILLTDGGISGGGPAAQAGLRGRDVIVQVGDHRVGDESDLAVAMIIHDPGETVNVEIYRDGDLQQVPVTLGSAS